MILQLLFPFAGNNRPDYAVWVEVASNMQRIAPISSEWRDKLYNIQDGGKIG
jgi:hypothetical protein